MFVVVYTKLNILFYIGRLSQNLQDPIKRYASRVKELGKYLKDIIKQRIRYGPPLKGSVYHDKYLMLFFNAD